MNLTSDTSPDAPEASAPSRSSSQGSLGTLTDLSRSLGDLTCAIGNRMQCDVCSIYRLDLQRQSLILAATVGLRQDCIERLRMSITEGLCGLVAQQRQPLNVAERAGEHPRFKFFPEAGEDSFESFLGVPVIDGASIVGVLVVQTIERRVFTDVDVKALALAGREMGPLLGQLRQQKGA